MLLKATAHGGTVANAKKHKTGDKGAHTDEQNVFSSHWSQTPYLKKKNSKIIGQRNGNGLVQLLGHSYVITYQEYVYI